MVSNTLITLNLYAHLLSGDITGNIKACRNCSGSHKRHRQRTPIAHAERVHDDAAKPEIVPATREHMHSQAPQRFSSLRMDDRKTEGQESHSGFLMYHLPPPNSFSQPLHEF